MPIAVITGSSSGIGRQTAIEFAKQGYSIVVHARKNLEGLQATAKRLREDGAHDVLCVTADIGNAEACRQLVESAFAWRGAVDAWINNAGVDVLTKNAQRQDFYSKLQQLLRVDVAGTIRICRQVVACMQQQRSRPQPSIVNIGWDQAWLGMEGDPGQLFCTSKGAVMSFTQALALTCGGQVRVNCVAPGWIKTAWGAEAASAYWEQRACSESMQHRWGTPGDVANAILWLASPGAEFVNGQIIPVNGGRRFYPN
jgi:3-oxoacyl-[acyl-carrier protein] reductase